MDKQDMRKVYAGFRDRVPQELTVAEVADLCALIMADYAPTKPIALQIAGMTALTVQAQPANAFNDARMN